MNWNVKKKTNKTSEVSKINQKNFCYKKINKNFEDVTFARRTLSSVGCFSWTFPSCFAAAFLAIEDAPFSNRVKTCSSRLKKMEIFDKIIKFEK